MAVYYCGAIFFVVLDRFLRMLSLHYFQGREASLIWDHLQFTFAKNYFIALSLPLSGVFLNWVIFFLICLLIFYFLRMYGQGNIFSAATIIIIIFGAFSNLYDRIIYGFVIDYLELKWLTVFNLADAMIVISVFVLFISDFKRREKFATLK